MWTGGSRFDNAACEYSVAWKKGREWRGLKTHLGPSQEEFGAEWMAIARALEVRAARRQRWELSWSGSRYSPMPSPPSAEWESCKIGPGQRHALHARAVRDRIDCPVESWWCPAHSGIEENEVADEWAKTAEDEPDRHGVEWLRHTDRYEHASSLSPPL